MSLQSSYFEVPTFTRLLRGLDRLLNPYRHYARVTVRHQATDIRWTARAQRALAERRSPLVAEMQLYFSCVVKKRVLFHDSPTGPSVRVNGELAVQFRPVESTACSPEDFVRGYPVRRELTSAAAARFAPAMLEIDFVDGDWQGSFQIGKSGQA